MPDPNETEIRRIIAARAKAVHDGDVEAMMSDVAEDVVTFDVVDPLRSIGKAAARKRAQEWLDSYDGSVTWEDRDVQVVASDDVAFSHRLSHVTGKLKKGTEADKGTEVDMWFRSTLGFHKRDGRWLIVHDHGSDPFDPESGKASLGLKP